MSSTTEYNAGCAQGRRLGEYDLAQMTATHHDSLVTFRESAYTAGVRDSRAYWLGVLRGYRQAVRTQARGRWGT